MQEGCEQQGEQRARAAPAVQRPKLGRLGEGARGEEAARALRERGVGAVLQLPAPCWAPVQALLSSQ